MLIWKFGLVALVSLVGYTHYWDGSIMGAEVPLHWALLNFVSFLQISTIFSLWNQEKLLGAVNVLIMLQ